MNKRTASEASKQNKRNFYSSYPWFPYPSAWLKALILVIIVGVFSRILSPIQILQFIATNTRSPEITTFFLILTLLFPIAAIAWTHHCSHFFISKFLPSIQAPEVGQTKGFLPSIMSWWSGLYAWLVIVLASLLGISVCIFLFPIFHLSFSVNVRNYDSFQNNIINIFGVLWFINAALLYHFEYKVREQIISISSRST